MFTSFARRLTGWYVVAATVLVALVLGAVAIVGLFVYVHLINDGIDADAREADAFSVRAAARHESFAVAAQEFEIRMARGGVRMVAAGPFRHHPPPGARRVAVSPVMRLSTPEPRELRGARPGDAGPFGPPPTVVADGKIVHADPRVLRFEGSRLGFAVGSLFGSRFTRVQFVDGDLTLLPDPNVLQNVVLLLLLGVLLVGAGAGVLAWFAGRYITSQALRPLIDVTNALHRFAARDFTPQAIAVAGKSEFDAIAVAYNSAAAQVAAAFEERTVAEAQMRQFVADAGHELRTPLTIVLGYIDLLRRRADEGDERSRRIFTSIASEGARMRTLIDNLVLLARMEGEDIRPSEPFALGPLLDEIVDARRVLVPGLRFDLDLAVDATVIGNREEIYEAVSNVVDNAIKYAPSSPIALSTQAVPGGVQLQIADRGPGIHPDDRPGIFERFFRGAMRGDVEGSGLGLPIAKRALERAGGTLLLSQTSARGTTFAIRLRTDGDPTPRQASTSKQPIGSRACRPEWERPDHE